MCCNISFRCFCTFFLFYCVFYLVFLAELELLARQPAHILFNSEKNADFSEPWSAKIGLSHHAMGPCEPFVSVFICPAGPLCCSQSPTEHPMPSLHVFSTTSSLRPYLPDESQGNFPEEKLPLQIIQQAGAAANAETRKLLSIGLLCSQ